jgi:hypothetical protein
MCRNVTAFIFDHGKNVNYIRKVKYKEKFSKIITRIRLER